MKRHAVSPVIETLLVSKAGESIELIRGKLYLWSRFTDPYPEVQPWLSLVAIKIMHVVSVFTSSDEAGIELTRGRLCSRNFTIRGIFKTNVGVLALPVSRCCWLCHRPKGIQTVASSFLLNL